jgi:hypothetical protein
MKKVCSQLLDKSFNYGLMKDQNQLDSLNGDLIQYYKQNLILVSKIFWHHVVWIDQLLYMIHEVTLR